MSQISFSRSQLKYIWLLFSFIFFVLACCHFRMASMEIGHFQNKGQIKTVNGIPVGVADTIKDLNEYVDQMNRNNKRSNYLAGGGYIAAMLTAIFSFLLDFQQRHPGQNVPGARIARALFSFPAERIKKLQGKRNKWRCSKPRNR